MAATVIGPRKWSMKRSADGHRDYTLVSRVRCATTDGPAVVLQASGLPTYGSTWSLDSDVDVYAYCQLEVEIEPVVEEGKPNPYFDVTNHFSTRPVDRCGTNQFQNPLSEPAKVSIAFTKFQEEATVDRFGLPIRTTSHEIIRGKEVEFDASNIIVKVEQNVYPLGMEVWGPMVDTLNDANLWGLPARCWKLNAPSEAKEAYYGQCLKYFQRVFELEARIKRRTGVYTAWNVTVASGGTGYTVGDTIYLAGGTYTSNAYLVVTAASAGIVTRAAVVWGGEYTSLPSNPVAQASSSSGGIGATFTVSWTNAVEGKWDRDVYDEGTKVLNGHWNRATGVFVLDNIAGQPPDPNNPQHFIRYKDPNGENARVMLCNGTPADTVVQTGTGSGTGTAGGCPPGQVHVEYYHESDFSALNLPQTIGW